MSAVNVSSKESPLVPLLSQVLTSDVFIAVIIQGKIVTNTLAVSWLPCVSCIV